MGDSYRKLATIVFADIVGYTAMMQENEAMSLSALQIFEKSIEIECEHYSGEIIQFYGDGCLMTFDNTTQAVQCAVALQKDFRSGDFKVPVRIGIHLGEIVVRNENTFGDSVNIASRIESMGIPGNILLSKSVTRQISNKPDFSFESLGFFSFKNVADDIEVFALNGDHLVIPNRSDLKGKFKEKPKRSNESKTAWIVIGATSVLLLLFFFGSHLWDGKTEKKDKINALAILPLQNLTSNDQLDYLGDGIAENLIQRLSNLEETKVISRFSSFLFRDSIDNLQSLAKALDVDGLFVGSLENVQDRVVMRGELISTNQMTQIWSIKEEVDSERLVELERAVVKGIRDNLGLSTNHKGIEEEEIDPVAYQHFMQGRHLSYGISEEEVEKAIGHFYKAIETDPNFAGAYAALANHKFTQAKFSNTSRQELEREARIAIQSALNIDSDHPEALLAQANMLFYSDNNWSGARNSYERALDADPNNALILADYAQFLTAMNEYDGALELAQRAIASDPVSVSSLHIIGWAHLFTNPQQAIIDFDNAVSLHPNFVWGYMKKGLGEILVGQCDKALLSMNQVENRKGDWGGELLEVYLSIAYNKCGMTEKAEQKMAEVLEHSTIHGVEDPLDIAFMYAGKGDLDLFIEWCERAIQEKSINVAFIQMLRGLDIYANNAFEDPRYLQFLRDLKFPNRR